MLRVVFDPEYPNPERRELQAALVELGVKTEDRSSDLHLDTFGDAIVAPAERVEQLLDASTHTGAGARIVASVADPSEATIRAAVRAGAQAVIDAAQPPSLQARAVVSAALGHFVLPGSAGRALTTRLDPPPAELSADDLELFRACATQSIESAGRALNLSRRQAQRRYRRLLDQLGLQTHLHAAVAAGRWGLAHPTGPNSTTSGVDTSGPPSQSGSS